MRFLLEDHQIEMQGSLARFLAENCPLTRLHAQFDGSEGYDRELWGGLLELGVGMLCLPTEYGGMGLELLDLAIAAEELGYAAAPVPFFGHALSMVALTLGGTDEQKRRWLTRLGSGTALGTAALGEPGGRWLPEQWTVNSGRTISGVKAFVPCAAESDLIIVGLASGALGIVENGPAVSCERIDAVDRTRRIDLVTFKDAPVDLLPGGAPLAAKLRDAALVLLAADAFGGARRCVTMAVDYAKEREQFDRKIASFQALRHQLANMALEVEPCRGLYWFAAHAFEHFESKRAWSAALAKAHVTDRFLQAARDNVEAHGGIGFTWEYHPHIWLKRAMFNWSWGGHADVHWARAADCASW